jgi:threonine synthase
VVAGDSADPFRCPCALAGDDRDHVLVPQPPPSTAVFAAADAPQPFVRYRELLWGYRWARSHGMSDDDWVRMALELDHAVAGVDGHGFVATPCAPYRSLAKAIGLASDALWVKDETCNVSGSHKARHLFGIALVLEAQERLGFADRATRATQELAIASCGNAALAAAVIARAAKRPLRVFIPGDANARVVERLHALGAKVQVCERRAGETGDPCVHAFVRARKQGAIPFCVQGNENGLTIEGGQTLAWEMAETLAAAGVTPDRLFVQTGGGALASALVSGLRLAVARGILPRLPRLHVVQTQGATPLRRAWERVTAHTGSLAEVMQEARGHRSRYMWPWESTPHSVAHGILDDETYDWANVVEGTIESDGWPVTASEDMLASARTLAHATGIHADATGAAGLAGLMTLAHDGVIGEHECIALVFSGVER